MKPLRPEQASITFKCAEGITCRGPLNVRRIPRTSSSNRELQSFASFIKERYEGWTDDNERLTTFMHRGLETKLGVLQAFGGRIKIDAVLQTSPPGASVRFCSVRPGEDCDATHVRSESVATESFPVEPGFYRVLVETSTRNGNMTLQDAYFLIVEDGQTYAEATRLFRLARSATSNDEPHRAEADLITYLYAMGTSIR